MEATESSKRIMSYLYEQIHGYSPQKEKEEAISKALKAQKSAINALRDIRLIKSVHALYKLGMDAKTIGKTIDLPLKKVLNILAQN